MSFYSGSESKAKATPFGGDFVVIQNKSDYALFYSTDLWRELESLPSIEFSF